mgnify:CR=1 FL=1
MLTHLQSNSSHATVTYLTGPLWFDADVTTPGTAIGDVRMNRDSLMVWNGATWSYANRTVSFGMTATAESALSWALRKMAEEEELENLLKEYPSLREAKMNFDVMVALVKDHKKGGEV